MKFRIEGKEEHVTKTFRMPKSLIDQMEDLAAKNNISLNQLIIMCAKFAMANIDESQL